MNAHVAALVRGCAWPYESNLYFREAHEELNHGDPIRALACLRFSQEVLRQDRLDNVAGYLAPLIEDRRLEEAREGLDLLMCCFHPERERSETYWRGYR